MGLDMYLEARKSVSGYELVDAAERAMNHAVLEAVGLPKDALDGRTVAVEVTAIQWRKANQIHGWFERNVADGELANVTHYFVSREQLRELRDACQKILATVVKGPELEGQGYPITSIDKELVADLLPPTQGFFFGSDDIDQWYVEDLETTATEIDKLLTDPVWEGWEFRYYSWW